MWIFVLLLAACGTRDQPPRPVEPARQAEAPREEALPEASPTLPAPPEPPIESEHEGIVFTEIVTGGARSADRLPLLVALHGFGDDDANFARSFAGLSLRARVAAARGVTPRNGGGYSWLPVPAPRDPEARALPIASVARRLEPAITALARSRPTCGLPIVTGFSQGGMVSFGLAASPAPVIAAAFPMGGYLPPSLVPSRAPPAAPRIVAFHGDADHVVSFDSARIGVIAMHDAGYAIELRAYQGIEHAIPPEMARDLEAELRASFRDCD